MRAAGKGHTDVCVRLAELGANPNLADEVNKDLLQLLLLLPALL